MCLFLAFFAVFRVDVLALAAYDALSELRFIKTQDLILSEVF